MTDDNIDFFVLKRLKFKFLKKLGCLCQDTDG